MKTSSLNENSSLVEKWLEEQPNPSDAFKKYSFEEIKSALQKWLTPEVEDGEEDIINEDESNSVVSQPISPILEDTSITKSKVSNYSLNTPKTKQSKGDQFNSLFEEEDDLPF